MQFSSRPLPVALWLLMVGLGAGAYGVGLQFTRTHGPVPVEGHISQLVPSPSRGDWMVPAICCARGEISAADVVASGSSGLLFSIPHPRDLTRAYRKLTGKTLRFMPLGSSGEHIIESHFLLDAAPIHRGQLVLIGMEPLRFRAFKAEHLRQFLASGTFYLLNPKDFIARNAELYPELKGVGEGWSGMALNLRISRERLVRRIRGQVGSWAAVHLFGADLEDYYSPPYVHKMHPTYRAKMSRLNLMMRFTFEWELKAPSIEQWRENFAKGEKSLLAVIATLQQRGAKVVLMEMPRSPALKAFYRPAMLKLYQTMVRRVCRKTGVELMDINNEVKLVVDEDFIDGFNHLGYRGRAKWVPRLLEHIRRLRND